MKPKRFPCSATLLLLLVIVSAALPGCSRGDRPPLGRVEGVVTVDGEPLAGATVSFKPLEGREAFGWTDDAGRYELYYIRDIKGTVVGTNIVRITTVVDEEPNGNAPPRSRRNLRFMLEREVTRGNNKIDFELNSEDARGGRRSA